MAIAAIGEAGALGREPLGAKLGWLLSGIAILFLGADAGAKILVPPIMAAYTPPQLHILTDPGLYRLLGSILAICTLLCAIPRTAGFGAMLLAGYLGGAIATHFIPGSPVFGNTLFGAYLGLALSAALWLREPRLRAILPLRA